MKTRPLSPIVFGLGFALAASAQNAPPAPLAGQSPAPAAAEPHGGGWQGQGQRGGREGWGGRGGWGGGGGILGTVTEVAADHYTIKTYAGETYVVHFSANTQIFKQAVRHQGEGGNRERPAPQMIKPSEIKVGDAIGVMGEVDAAQKSVGAARIVQIDPERAKEMQEMQANYGKTWLMGKVAAVDGVKVTLLGRDNASQVFQADENTIFRKHRAPITLAEIQPGDMVRVEGAAKAGTFLASSVFVMDMPPGGTPMVPREAPPVPVPQPK